MAKAKTKAQRYAVADGAALVKLMVRAGVGSMKVEIARDALYRKAVIDESVATVDDVLDSLRADSRVFPKNIELYERLAEFGEEYWDDKGNIREEKARVVPNIEDMLTGKGGAKAAVQRLKEQAGDFDPDLEPGGLDRTDSPALHSEDAQAEETRQQIGDSVSQEEAEERAEAARKEAAKPHQPQTSGPGAPGTVTPKIVPPGTGQGTQEEANRAKAEADKRAAGNPPDDKSKPGKSGRG